MKSCNILLVIAGIALKICVILYACKSNYIAGLFFAAEISVVCCSMYFIKRRWRTLYIPLILIILLQLINFAGTGNLLDSETLQNMNEGGALDTSFIIRLAVFAAIAAVAMIPEFLVPRVNKSDNNKTRRITLHYITLHYCSALL